MGSIDLPRLAKLVFADWDEAPEAMAFEKPWDAILADTAGLSSRLGERADEAIAEPAAMPAAYWRDSIELFVRIPAIINVVLNWKICVEQGLPLHPTLYFEVNDLTRNAFEHPVELRKRAHAAYLESMAVARCLMRLDAQAPERIASLSGMVDPEILGHVFTSRPDKYTWRGSDPSKVLKLASRIKGSGAASDHPALVLGAAHGSILSALVLAETLGCDLYFLRFSMFKRNDSSPIISEADVGELARWKSEPVILFDEDVAKGTTLTIFSEKVSPLFVGARTAAVIRHGLASFRPDFIGFDWYD